MFVLPHWLARAAGYGMVASALLGGTSVSNAQDLPPIPKLELGNEEPRPLVRVAPSIAATKVSSAPALLFDSAVPLAKEVAVPFATQSPEAAPVAPTDAVQPKSAWYDNPPVHPFPFLGNVFVAPKGPGYYSGLDWLLGDFREAPPKNAYPAHAIKAPSFFNADFRYVDAPGYEPTWLEQLHRIHMGDDWMFATGGSAWWRHMREFNSRLTGKTNDYDLIRGRVFGDLWYQDRFRIYVEFITADTANQNLPPLKIDENRADLLNLFVDVKMGEFACQPIYLRVGRQELLFGSQRLVSTLDWANTRRTFEGVSAFWQNEKWSADAWWTRPVIIDNSRFDYADHNQNFAGAWVTYRPKKTETIDLYYLYLDNHNHTVAKTLVTAPTAVNTFGSRYVGNRDGFLWDFEGMLQFGQTGPHNLAAGAATAGLGYNWAKGPMNPTVWAYYDWASGDGSPNAGNANTFNQLFPFGHYYLGFLDLVGRQNIRDWNFHLYLNPAKWITFNAQVHIFQLDRARDALYAASGAPLRLSANGSAGGYVGQELDLLANFHVSRNSDVLVGWSKLNAGEVITNTGPGRSPELFYVMYNIRW